jgi:FkbM family methyltransferase
MIEQWRTLRRNQRALGFSCGAHWTFLRSANYRGWVKRSAIVHPVQLQHPIRIRMQESSDPDVFDQLFIDDELSFIRALSGIATVVDLGANVGYASARFLSAFPSATVIAVEPDPGNAGLCRANLAPYGSRARVVEAAVWHSVGSLVLSRGTFRDGREWSTEVRPARQGEMGDVIAYDIDSLIPEPIDLLKIDIEGSEAALFSRNTRWLTRVRNLCIEIHDNQCERTVFDALSVYQYAHERCGEYHLFLNLNTHVTP